MPPAFAARSARDLLQRASLSEAEAWSISGHMRRHHLQLRRESLDYWQRALATAAG